MFDVELCAVGTPKDPIAIIIANYYVNYSNTTDFDVKCQLNTSAITVIS